MASSILYQLLLVAFIYSTLLTSAHSTVQNDAEEEEEEDTPRDVHAKITGSGQNLTVMIGGTIKLECPMAGGDELPLTWTLNKMTLGLLIPPSSAHIQAENVKGRLKLHKKAFDLSNVQLSDEGEYSCSLSTNPPLVVTHHVKVISLSAGTILSPGSPITIVTNENETLRLICSIQHEPNQTISWSHQAGGKEPKKLPHKGPVMELAGININHNGTYTCQKEGNMDDMMPASAVAHVIVNVTAELLSKPEEIIDATVGDDVTLECKFKGNPLPSVTWRFNNKEYPTESHEDKVVIKSVKQEHGGVYKCTLTQDDKQLTRTITLRVQHKEFSSDVQSEKESTSNVDNSSVATSLSLSLALLSSMLLSLILS